ncbi:ABC transporter substrate-binding protein [Peptococcus simiae]|uniref:ABC transporter substrate-binding protein n=1 Tax=Peptococcus simiae TaxID=1643805 RepID=A0ABW9GZL3_9FIRM
MFKRLLGIGLSLTLLMTMVACGAGDRAPGSSLPAGEGPGLTVATLNQLDAWPAYAALQGDQAKGYDLKSYQTGIRLVEDGALEKWQIGDVGAVPALLGVLNRHLTIVGVAAEESDANWLLTKAGHPILTEKTGGLAGTSELVRGKTIYVTQASSGHALVHAYLTHLGLTEADVNLQYGSPKECLQALGDGTADLVALWAPYTYQAESIAGGVEQVAKGSDLGIHQYMLYVANSTWAENNKEVLATFLADVSREAAGIDELADKDLVAFFKDYAGATLTEDQVATDRQTHRLLSLEDQLALMENGDLARGMDEVARFLTQTNRFADRNYTELAEKNFGIDTSYLKAAQALQ